MWSITRYRVSNDKRHVDSSTCLAVSPLSAGHLLIKWRRLQAIAQVVGNVNREVIKHTISLQWVTLTPMMMPMRGPMEKGTRKPSICVMLAPACVQQHRH